MLTRMYAIDEDVLETFFGPDAKPIPVGAIGPEHGQLVFDGNLEVQPNEGDVVVARVGVTETEEFIVLLRVYHVATDVAELIVHRRHFEGGLAS